MLLRSRRAKISYNSNKCMFSLALPDKTGYEQMVVGCSSLTSGSRPTGVIVGIEHGMARLLQIADTRLNL